MGARTSNNASVQLGDSLMEAVGRWLQDNRSPGRKVNEVDNRLVARVLGPALQTFFFTNISSFDRLSVFNQTNQVAIQLFV